MNTRNPFEDNERGLEINKPGELKITPKLTRAQRRKLERLLKKRKK
jgi:hypothetical protein